MTDRQKALEADIQNIRDAIYHSKRPNGAGASLDRILSALQPEPSVDVEADKKINATVDGRSFETMGEFIAYSEGRKAGWNSHLKVVGTTPIVLVPENASLIHKLILAAEEQDRLINEGKHDEDYLHERFRLTAYSIHLEARRGLLKTGGKR